MFNPIEIFYVPLITPCLMPTPVRDPRKIEIVNIFSIKYLGNYLGNIKIRHLL